VALIAPPQALTFHRHLLDGIQSTGIDFEVLKGATLNDGEDQIKDAIQARLAAPDAPDGWICPGEVSGLAALAAVQDAGRVPGRDIHLIAKQTTGLFGLVRPKIHTLYEDLPAAGAKLAALLLRRIAGEAPDGLNYIQPVSNVRPHQIPKE
jgi:LacI family transcriptional regulator